MSDEWTVMPGRRNLLEMKLVAGRPAVRQRPALGLSDAELEFVMTYYWPAGAKLGEELVEALLFRLADLLDEKRSHLTSMQQALEDVARLTSGQPLFLEGRLSETRAFTVVARRRKVEVGSLKKAWQRYKMKQSASPGTKSP